MKKLLIVAAIMSAFAAQAQQVGSAAQEQNSTNTVQSSATGTATNAGNQQNITFTSPPTTTSTSTINGTQTVNSVRSGIATDRVEYDGSYTIKNTPSVNGPPLTTSNDTCMGSTSGSANGTGFGLSFGTTWTDEHCKNLKMSRELWNKGMKAASLAVDCENAVAKRALEMTGSKCPQSMTAEERRASFGSFANVEGAPLVSSTPEATAEYLAKLKAEKAELEAQLAAAKAAKAAQQQQAAAAQTQQMAVAPKAEFIDMRDIKTSKLPSAAR